MALADYLQPHERVAAECGQVAATNLRLIHHVARSGAPLFRELPYSMVQSIRLAQRPRNTTVVLGAVIAVLSLLAGLGSPLQIGAAGLGAAAVLLGIVFGDLTLVITTDTGGEKPTRWPLREVGRRESQELVAVARAAMSGEYDFAAEPVAAPPTPSVVARSVLLVPADDAALMLAALSGESDVLCLDLTTLVHASRRAEARELVASAVAAAKRAERRAWVRVSIDEAEADVAACAWPGLEGVVARVESAEDVRRLDSALNELESERGLPELVRIVVQVDSAAGVWALRETLGASPRVSGVIVAAHDALDLLGRPDARATWGTLRAPVLPESAYLRGRIAATASEAGVPVYASLATGIAPGGLVDALRYDAEQRLAEAAVAARAHGYHGALTLHAEAIAACNAAFPGTPPPSVQPAAAPAPSAWQPVVPSHFGIGVARAEEATEASTPDASADGADDEPEAPSVASTSAPSAAPPTAPVVWQPVVPSHFGIRVPPREPGADGEGVDEAPAAETPIADAPSVEES